jgi:hypothetical protein
MSDAKAVASYIHVLQEMEFEGTTTQELANRIERRWGFKPSPNYVDAALRKLSADGRVRETLVQTVGSHPHSLWSQNLVIEKRKEDPAMVDKVVDELKVAHNPAQKQCVVQVYIDNGTVYEYDVKSPKAAREHADAIIKGGYRHTDNDTGEMEVYPVHRIAKVKCTGGLTTSYPDRVRGT